MKGPRWLVNNAGTKLLALVLAVTVWWAVRTKLLHDQAGGVDLLGRQSWIQVGLQPGYMQVVGAPGAGYESLPGALRCNPSEVHVHGPEEEIAALQQVLAEGKQPLLEPLTIPPGAQSDCVVRLSLHPRLLQRDLRMEPAQVTATLPIRPRGRQQVSFTLDSSQVLVAGDGWRLRPFAAPRVFVATVREEPGLDLLLDQTWLSAHLFVYVLPAEQAGAPVRMQWDLHGLSPELEARLRQALLLQPASGQDQDWLVQLEPIPHE